MKTDLVKQHSSLKANTLAIVFFVSLMILSHGCTDFGTSPEDSLNGPGGGIPFDTVSFSAEIRDTLVIFCGQVGCHGGGAVQGGLLMGSISWNEIRNASGDHGPIIVPGDAATSNLYNKLTITPPFGDRMPQFGPYLSTQFQEKVRDWINQGARDN